MYWSDTEKYGVFFDAVVSAYDTASLKIMLRKRLGVNLAEITNETSPLPTNVGDLIDWAERDGRTEDLVAAVLADQPTNEKVREYKARYGKGEEIRAESVTRHLQDLMSLVRHQAVMMTLAMPPDEEVVIDRSTLPSVLNKRSFKISPEMENAVRQLHLRELIAVLVHDEWLLRSHEGGEFQFDADSVTIDDIISAMKVEVL